MAMVGTTSRPPPGLPSLTCAAESGRSGPELQEGSFIQKALKFKYHKSNFYRQSEFHQQMI